METWIITPLGHFSKSARRQFGAYTVVVGYGPSGGTWRIDASGTEIARCTAPTPVKDVEEAISVATSQIAALVNALAPFSALAAELAEAEAVIASTRALLNEAHAALARQAARIAELENETNWRKGKMEDLKFVIDDMQNEIEELQGQL